MHSTKKKKKKHKMSTIEDKMFRFLTSVFMFMFFYL